MPNGLTIHVKGLKELQKRIGAIAPAVIEKVDAEMYAAANDFANRAIDDAPVDEGLLRQGISANREATLHYEVVSAADYSAYVEWGTKSKVEIPQDLTAYAAQFRSNGKASHEFFERILAWVRRNGVAGRYSTKTRKKLNSKADQDREYQAARAIYYHILKYGVSAKPFFFKQRKPVYAALQKRLAPAVKEALQK